ncbi:MAG TPA: 2-phospho-L-lactate guanylyltransferase [Dehalococcoidia bacterium]|nr:2-phospho-L-lactate guanylyltransferase [Dehalococcoidia bacterium]MDP7161198.1 2-phospho-L-lactate guanylyltransferase [Dehalococcoidia bacterium]MDP7213556.1 2-phospho-L-lactate guanylyltransferase [Dehalococcoidia bacterium]HJM52847.1 2-phospho-L-lactate guanylyltransferase [Dehalococcoidia bacterium]
MPMKPIAESKTRLAPALSDDLRVIVSLGMLVRVVAAATDTVGVEDVVVYGGDEAVCLACQRLGAGWRPDPGLGLNGCMRVGFSDAREEGPTHGLFLPADLPLITPDELSVFISAGIDEPVTIAPDLAEDGTNALLIALTTTFPTLLGEASFGKHVKQAEQHGVGHVVHRSDGIGLDIDTGADLERLMDLAPGFWDDLQLELREAGVEAFAPVNPVKEGAE